MTKPESRTEKQRPQKPKSAAQRAAEANKAQQLAVRANGPRPNDRTQPGEHDAHLRPKR